jgi:FKBP-type peptidyl-prolyl cis-trans isomerase SlyD
MTEIIEQNKLVELRYEIVDKKTGDVFTSIDYPVAYVHGAESVLSPQVTDQLDGREAGDIIKLPINCDEIYGPRDESLVFTDSIENVPKEYHEVGTTITMENDKGVPKNFIVTRFDDKTLTIDGNNPLCGRDVVFKLEVLAIRDATEEEIALGGKVGADPTLDDILKK